MGKPSNEQEAIIQANITARNANILKISKNIRKLLLNTSKVDVTIKNIFKLVKLVDPDLSPQWVVSAPILQEVLILLNGAQHGVLTSKLAVSCCLNVNSLISRSANWSKVKDWFDLFVALPDATRTLQLLKAACDALHLPAATVVLEKFEVLLSSPESVAFSLLNSDEQSQLHKASQLVQLAASNRTPLTTQKTLQLV